MKKQALLLLLIVLTSYSFAQQSWQESTKIADSLQLKFKFKKSLELREVALNSNDIPKDTIPFLKLLKNIGEQEVNISDKDLRKKAYKKLKKQLVQLEALGAKPERLYQSYRRLYIFAHNYMRDMKESRIYVNKSLDHHFNCKKIDSTTLLKTMHTLGVVSRQLGMLDESTKIFSKSINFYNSTKVKDTNMLGALYTDLASIYDNRYLNIPQKNIEYLKKAEHTFRQVKKPNLDYLISIYSRLSTQERTKGKFQNAIGYLNKGYNIYLQKRELVQQYRMAKLGVLRDIQYHINITRIYQELNDDENTLLYINKALKLIKDKDLTPHESDMACFVYLDAAEYYNNNEKLALKYIDKGIKLNKSKSEEYIIPIFLLEKVKVFIKTKEYKKANKVLDIILKDEKMPKHRIKPTLKYRTLVYLKLKDSIKAFNTINKILYDINKQEQDIKLNEIDYNNYIPSPVLDDARYILDLINYLKGSDLKVEKEIDKLYWLALKQFKHNYNNQFLTDKLNTTYSKITLHFYNRIVNGELNKKQKKEFLDFTETIENKFSLNNFFENRSVPSTNKINALITKEHFTRSNIVYYKKQLLKIENDSIKIDSVKQLIFEKNIKLATINDSLKLLKKGYEQLTDTKVYLNNLEQLKESHIIKYKVIRDTLFRMVFHNKNVQIHKINNLSALKDDVNKFVSLIKNPVTSIAEIKKQGSSLYSILFKELDITKMKDIHIIPDDILHYLPFDLLVTNDQYLVQQKAISYASSLSFLLSPSTVKQKTREKDIALFAPSYKLFKPTEVEIASRGEENPYYLAGAIEEAESISKLFESDLFINDDASKSAFQNISNKYDIIHLSMHSFLNDEDSELNSLVFTDKEQDYELHISELYGLNLNADMVVLSACNTGVGNLKTGRGIVSMNTAFTFAGVPSVVSSLWSAPDKETKTSMISYYKNLKKGMAKNVALQQAKLNYLNTVSEEELKHPYYWAGFVIYGDNSPIIDANKNRYLLLGVALIILIIILFKKKLFHFFK